MTKVDNKGWFPDIKGKKRKFAEELASPEFDGNISALCKKHEISRQSFYNWMNADDGRFKDYLNWLINQYTDSEIVNAWRSLIGEVKNGDVQAIKLFFELKGQYKQQIDVGGGVTIIGGEADLE